MDDISFVQLITVCIVMYWM